MYVPATLRAVCVAATVVLAAVTVASGSLNAFEPAKLFVVATGATAAGAATWLSWGGGRVRFPSRSVVVAAAAVVVVIALAAVVASPKPAASVIGARTRWGGLLLYAACAGLLVVTTTLGRQGIRLVLGGIAVASGLVAAIGLLQGLGVPILEGIGSQIGSPSTLGNINFASGFVGASAGAAAWLALDPGFDRIVRAFGALLLALAVIYTLASASFQGIPTLGAVLLVVAVHRAWVAGGSWRRIAVPALALVAVAAAGVVALGLFQTGPLASLGAESGVRLRRGYWGAALSMLADNPLLGVGPEQYVYAFRTHRTYDAAAAMNVFLDNDAAHNIFLHHGAAGGLLLLGAFVGLVGAVVVAAVRGYRRADVDATLLTGAVAVLVGYLVQGLVSIDVVALATLGWVAMGLVVAAAHVAVPAAAKSRRRSRQKRTRTPAGAVAGWPQVALAVFLVAAVAVVAVQPLRADTAALRGLRRPTAQAKALGAARAADIGVWDPRYDEALGLALVVEGDPEGLALLEKLYADGFLTGGSAVQVARRVAEQDPAAATVWYERALTVDPLHPEIRLDAARLFGRQGDTTRAMELIEGVLADDPDHPQALRLADRFGT